MPYENEIAVRLNDPGDYKDIRRENDKFGDGVSVLWGVRDDGKLDLQALRFDREKFGAKEVEKWLSEHGYRGTIEASEQSVPRRMMRKVAIRVGDFEADGKKLAVSESDLKHWSATFRKMKAAGIDVPLCSDHDMAASDTLGQVHDLEVVGDELIATVEVIGEKAIESALRNNCSIYAPVKFKAGDGQVYEQPILHLAVTPYPLIPGLGRFQPIAASNVRRLSKEANAMDKFAQRIARVLNLGEDADEEKVAEMVDELVKKVDDLTEKVAAAAEKPDEGKEDDEEKEKELSAMKAEVVASRRETRELKLAHLVADGKLSAAARDKIRKQFVTDATLETFGADGFDLVCSVIAENTVLPTGERTRFQIPNNAAGNGGPSNPLIANMTRRGILKGGN